MVKTREGSTSSLDRGHNEWSFSEVDPLCIVYFGILAATLYIL